MAMARASAASSGLGMVFSLKVFWTMSWTCSLVALP